MELNDNKDKSSLVFGHTYFTSFTLVSHESIYLETYKLIYQVCVGTKKKSIQIWSVDQEKITVLKEIGVSEIPHLLVCILNIYTI